MLKVIKMFCCMPFMVIGAAVGIISRCVAEGYNWGRDEFFQG